MSIGVGIITCDRPEFYKQCYESILRCKDVDELITVDDGETMVDTDSYYLQTPNARSGVGIAKNIAFRHLLDKKCDYIFLIEDDIIVTDSDVFKQYIHTMRKTGIEHLMFGYHGPANKTFDKFPNPKYIIQYGDDFSLLLNTHCVGAFTAYTRHCLESVGLIDEDYKNAFEHIDHSYKIAKNNLTTPYWNWADINNSWKYLNELACSEDNSAIRFRPDWSKNIKTGFKLFFEKHGDYPVNVPDTPLPAIKQKLKKIYENRNRN